jgi:hypothetical protein
LLANRRLRGNVDRTNRKSGTSPEAKMRAICAAAAAAVFMCGAAHGQTQNGENAAVGVGIICNTPAEAKQFVGLRRSGVQPDQAMNAVNTGARDARACGVAAIAYIRDGMVETMTLDNKLVQIVRINVVAGFNGSSWQRVSDMVQYAVLEGGGESI